MHTRLAPDHASTMCVIMLRLKLTAGNFTKHLEVLEEVELEQKGMLLVAGMNMQYDSQKSTISGVNTG